MRLYSTKNTTNFVSLEEAVFKGLPDDNGLFMPEAIPPLPDEFIQNLKDYSFQEIGFEVCKHLLKGVIPETDLQNIIEQSITFPAPLVKLSEEAYILELFHGPSLAFKDFGARFMAQLMSYFNKGNDRELVILVATSGDTGGAVAAGFYKTPGIKVVILYPSGKVSHLQEKQLTTLGENVTAIEVDGTFDDCQALVKQAFLDKNLTNNIRLSSANSINIARLIPQSFYYFEAYKQLPRDGNPVAFCVPSGNFGNLTAGLFAKKMGLPIHQFIAATNSNDVVPAYLYSGTYTPRPSVVTLSNAMDVGNPSNFARILDIYCSTWNNIKGDIKGYSFDDKQTEGCMRDVFSKYSYVLDPHGAVGYLALSKHQAQNKDTKGVVLETAHPSKFLPDVERILGQKIEVPERLAILSEREKSTTKMGIGYESFKDWLLRNY
ncbi:MAG: threonine synthase [Saprospiraceae bacterium]|nr:threonine synthase [Saprospiraceae bacterium]MCF8251312.1 threonine synthase [Saprospiraceae bacterium]MCF8280613.1 threonine synthase [Bacteroidales bacterium]MCF8313187.1 threonine synthase [Saprospiraceae bacterium]MCF8441649.1 threonine synthase [Saprospiraceae bacterium]